MAIQHTPGFDGTPDELEALLMHGLASGEIAEEEFWDSVERETAQLSAICKSHSNPRP
jgi:hypothetical protein